MDKEQFTTRVIVDCYRRAKVIYPITPMEIEYNQILDDKIADEINLSTNPNQCEKTHSKSEQWTVEN